MKALFQQNLKVVNVGLQGFADNIGAAGGEVTHLSWAPPAGADAALGWTLAEHDRRPAYRGGQPHRLRTLSRRAAAAGRSRAGARRHRRHSPRRAAHPARRSADRLGGHVRPAAGRDLPAPFFTKAGPTTLEAAESAGRQRRGRAGAVPAHGAVGPMAGIISPSMPVWVVENTDRREPRVLQSQRGPGQGAALRRQLARGARPPALAGRRVLHATMQVAVRGARPIRISSR